MKHALAAMAFTGLLAVPVVGQSTATSPATHAQQNQPPDDYWLGRESGGTAGSLPFHFDIGVRAVSLQEVNASDSYDAVFGGDAVTQIGVQLEFRMREHFLVALAYETGSVDGCLVLRTTPPQCGFGDTELTLSPIHLTAGWVFAPTSSWHGFVGVGPTWLDWEEEASDDDGRIPCPEGATCDDSKLGYHGAAGLRWSTPGRRFTTGLELRYSSVDAVGEGGITEEFGEEDLGGTTIGLSLLWRVR